MMKKNGINDEECKKWVIKALNDYKVHSRKQIIDSQSSFESPGFPSFIDKLFSLWLDGLIVIFIFKKADA